MKSIRFLSICCLLIPGLCFAEPARTFPEKIVILDTELSLKEKKDIGSGGFIAEYIPEGKTWENYDILFAIRFYPGNDGDPLLSANATAKNLFRRKAVDPLANGSVYKSKDGKSFLVDFIISDGKDPLKLLEHNVFRFLGGTKGVLSYQIVRRAYSSEKTNEEMNNFIKGIALLREKIFQDISRPNLPNSDIVN